MRNFNKYGNTEIFKQHKIAFLCSRRCPSSIIMKTYDWTTEQRDRGNCIMSGFHSIIEKDVLHFLLKGRQAMIMCLARGLKKKYEPELKQAIDAGRLLVLTPFESDTTRVSRQNAKLRNDFMCDLADSIFIPYATPGGNTETLVNKYLCRKPIYTFDVEENEWIIRAGLRVPSFSQPQPKGAQPNGKISP